MKVPASFEELPASLQQDTNLYINVHRLPGDAADLLKILVRIAFHTGAAEGLKSFTKEPLSKVAT